MNCGNAERKIKRMNHRFRIVGGIAFTIGLVSYLYYSSTVEPKVSLLILYINIE